MACARWVHAKTAANIKPTTGTLCAAKRDMNWRPGLKNAEEHRVNPKTLMPSVPEVAAKCKHLLKK